MCAMILFVVMFTVFALMLFWPALAFQKGIGMHSARLVVRSAHSLSAKPPVAKDKTEYWQGDWVSYMLTFHQQFTKFVDLRSL